MQTTRELVIIGTKLATGMQFSQDDFNPALTIFRVNIHWHTTAIVFD